MIGIISRYRKHDATLAALAVANRLEVLGRPYDLNRYDWRVGTLDPDFDHRVKRVKFQSWLPKINHLVWTAPVDNYYLDMARKSGVRSTLYTSWDQIEPYDEKIIGAYTHVLVPSLTQAVHIRDKFKLRNIAMLPYDTSLPITNRADYDRSRRSVRLFLSLYGTQLNRVDFQSILLLADIVRDFAQVEVTIACAKGLAMYTVKELKKLVKTYGERWRVLWDCSWKDQAVEMGKHDLTVWPARWDGFGTIPTTSLTLGTPVIAWDAAPMNEYLSGGHNAILVKCQVEYNWLGMPHVKPDYVEFDHALRWLLERPDSIAELKKHTGDKLEERRDDFCKGWEAVLPVAM